MITRVARSRAALFAGAMFMCIAAGPNAGLSAPRLLVGNISDPELVAALEAGSNLASLFRSSNTVAPALPLDERHFELELTKERLSGILHSYGYLEGHIETIAPQPATKAEKGDRLDLRECDRLDPRKCDRLDLRKGDSFEGLVLDAIPGPLYRIGSIEISRVGEVGLDQSTLLEARNLFEEYLKLGARSDNLDDLEQHILMLIYRQSYVFANIVGRTMQLDHPSATVAVIFAIEVGQRGRFGPVTFSGLRRSKPEDLLKYLTFSPGDPFNHGLLDDLTRRLRELKSFASVRITVPPAPDREGLVPVNIEVEELPPNISELAATGIMGQTVTTATLAVVAFYIIGTAARVSRRFTLPLFILSLAFLSATAVVSLHRILSFVRPDLQAAFDAQFNSVLPSLFRL